MKESTLTNRSTICMAEVADFSKSPWIPSTIPAHHRTSRNPAENTDSLPALQLQHTLLPLMGPTPFQRPECVVDEMEKKLCISPYRLKHWYILFGRRAGTTTLSVWQHFLSPRMAHQI
jgi:hypothetical protein